MDVVFCKNINGVKAMRQREAANVMSIRLLFVII